MNPNEMIFGLLLIGVLLSLSGYFSWRQWVNWKRTYTDPQMDLSDKHFLRTQAWRRWIGCALMVLLACCLAGTWFLEGRYQQVVRQDTSNAPAETTEQKEAKKDFVRFYTCYWVFTLLVFLLVIAIAGLDARAVLREGIRKHRELRDAEKAMLEEEIRNYRSGNNGHM